MQVKVGFNTDFGHDKFDVGLDETDLARILAEEGIPPDVLLTSLEAFKLLNAEAERICAAKRAVVEKGQAEQWSQEVTRLTTQRRLLLAKIKARLGVEQPAAA